MVVRSVHSTDYQELLAVWEDSVRATHDFISEADIAYFKPIIINEAFPHVTLWCIENALSQIVGFIGVAGQKVEMLFVLSAYRGKGIGRELLNYAKAHAAVTLVDVNEQNPQAVGFYQAQGFEVYDRSPLDDMGKPFPILRMRLAS
ncbi:GNAT family N-acetyltransferase [Pseudoalteromonas fenneropenaei]|uniref:GNAT family N-acetyltransferase n=1 Tax=Pseudoalteromonas fenneropenaei TaxID=1737459 RepID=A0ABV7CJD4_9GAMM